jgi:hypothetical protein
MLSVSQTISLRKDTPETSKLYHNPILRAEVLYSSITPDGHVQIIRTQTSPPYRFYRNNRFLDADENEYLAYERKAESIERTKWLEEQPKPLGWRKRLSNLFQWMTGAGKDKTAPQVDVVENPSTPSSQHSFDEPRSE